MYVDTVYGFYGYSFLCLIGCFSMITWTPTVLSVLYACVLYFCICTCSAHLSRFHMERRSTNTLIIIIIYDVQDDELYLHNKAWSGQCSNSWLVGCLTSQQQASVSQGRICSDNFTCCHTEIEDADQTFYLTQSQYTDTRPISLCCCDRLFGLVVRRPP